MKQPADQLRVKSVEQLRVVLAKIRSRESKADKKLRALCEGRERWRMSIPAQPENDSDLVLGRSLYDVSRLLCMVETMAEALEFYAQQRNYRLTAGDRCHEHGHHVCAMEHQDSWDGQPGARARAALALSSKESVSFASDVAESA